MIQQAEPKVASSLTHPSFCLPAPQSLLWKPTPASHISNHKALSSFLPQPCRLGGIGCLTSEETEARRCFLILHLLSPSSRVLERWLPFPCLYHCALDNSWPASFYLSVGNTALDLPVSLVMSVYVVLLNTSELRLWPRSSEEGSSQFLHPCYASSARLNVSPAFSPVFIVTL